MTNRKHRDLPPFVGRLHGDDLLSLVAAADSIESVCLVTGVRRWQVYQWIRDAKR